MEANHEAQPDEPSKLCTECLELKPLTQFRFRSRDRDRRHHQCNTCAARYKRLRLALRRRKTLDDSLFILRYYRECPGRLEHLAATLITVFNGAIGYAAEFSAAFDAAFNAGDHKAVQRYLAGITDFCFAADLIKARRAKEEKRRQQRAAQAHLADRRKYDYEDDLWR